MQEPQDDLLATRDASKLLDRSEATIRMWARSGKLKAIRLPSGQNLFQRSDVERLRDELREAQQSSESVGAAR